MAPVSLKFGSTDEERTGPSFRERFHAWWEGYELPPPEADADAAANAAPEPPEPVDEWPTPRQELVQMLWGEGFSIPGEEDYVLELVKPFGLTKENTMLEFGAGLGGGARTIASKIGTYVDGFDLNEDVAAQATELALMKGLEKKASVKAFHPEKLDLRRNYYDACLIRETLMAIEDKEALIEKVLASLKPHASIVIADFFISGRAPGPAARAALEAESRETWPSQAGPLIAQVEALGFELRIDNDETDSYAHSARGGWANVAAKLARKAVSDDVSLALMRETELWKRRNAAFAAGELQMRRIVCSKQS